MDVMLSRRDRRVKKEIYRLGIFVLLGLVAGGLLLWILSGPKR